ncbi:MAG: adenylate/guanylate cyclase domain-containing protein [Chloroflexota bacterium]
MSLSSLESPQQSAAVNAADSEPTPEEKTADSSTPNQPNTTIADDASATPPKVRLPMRAKITVPYALLALFVIIAAAYFVTQLVTENVAERFTRQLVEVGQLTTDWMVQEEQQRLETLRLIVHTDGVAQQIAAGDAEKLRELVLPLAVNSREEAVEILTPDGVSLLSLRHVTGGNIEEYEAEKGNDVFASWPFVASVLAGEVDDGQDKFAGAVQAEWGDYFYIAGPVLDSNGRLLGVVLVGKSLPTLVSQIRQETFAQITIYDFQGQPHVSTLPFESASGLAATETAVVTTPQTDTAPLREQQAGSIAYTEILAPWTARTDINMGIIGAALPQTTLVQASQNLRLQIFVLTIAIFIAVIAVGLLLARRITEPLESLVTTVGEVAEGKLTAQATPTGRDEIAFLAYSVNNMIYNLREGELYRDLLGRAVTPEVRDELRHLIDKGDVRLEGETKEATVLFSDIRRFTSIAEAEGADATFKLLNEYLGEVVPAVTENSGLITEFAGDALLAFFGLLPRPLDIHESAYQACQAALKMVDLIDEMNKERRFVGKPPFVTGIGINTGEVAAGGIGSADRIHYTVIGDTVNTAQRLEAFTKRFDETAVVISEHTWQALGERQEEFRIEALGEQQFKGKTESLAVYRLSSKIVSSGRLAPNLNWSRIGEG